MEPKEMKIWGTATIWIKWQVVIPKYVRDSINLNYGDEVIFLVHGQKFLWLIKNDDLELLMDCTKSIWIKMI